MTNPGTTPSVLQKLFGDGCPYQDRCSDKGNKCTTCENNPNKSYYEPRIPFMYPKQNMGDNNLEQ